MRSTSPGRLSPFRLLALPFQGSITSCGATHLLDMSTLPKCLLVLLFTPVEIIGYSRVNNLVSLLEMVLVGVSCHFPTPRIKETTR